MYYSKVTYQAGSSYYIIDMYLAAPQLSGYGSAGCISAYDSFYNAVANLARLNPNAIDPVLDNEYCQIRGIVK